jgi:hypothetical protein
MFILYLLAAELQKKIVFRVAAHATQRKKILHTGGFHATQHHLQRTRATSRQSRNNLISQARRRRRVPLNQAVSLLLER